MQQHPKILPFLFLTEMWERFGFYVVQGLLILFLTEYFGYSDVEGYTILGVFSALVYISPFIGGIIADRLMGFKNSILWGGLFLVIGYAILAIPSQTYEKNTFYLSLATIIIGNGLFKPNISSLLGAQYEKDNPRRDSGFTIFYIGINIGTLLSSLSSGYIKEYFGWHLSFALASIGLIIGLITFLFGLKYLNSPVAESQRVRTVSSKIKFFFCCLLAILGLNFLLQMQGLTNWLLPSTGILMLVFLIALTLQQPQENRRNMFVLILLILSSVVFWTLFLQMFFSFNLFVERLVDKNFFGLHLTTTVFYGSESIFIILLGPFFAWLWHQLAISNKNPSSINKFLLGIVSTGMGCFVMSISTLYPDATGLIHPLWIFGAYCFITVGELLISPIGLSAITLLAPSNLSGMMMGIWFVALGFGGLFAGMIAKMASLPETMVNLTDKLLVYHNAFLNYAYLAFVVAIILFFLNVFLKMRRID